MYSSFKDNVWGVNLADMQLTSKHSKRIKYLLCVIDLFSKYAWVVLLKDKKGATITNAFQKKINSSTHHDVCIQQIMKCINKSKRI